MMVVVNLSSRYITPPLVSHLGDMVLATTKPQLLTAAKFVYPLQAQIVPATADGAPLTIEMQASGLVYDAEYTWRVFFNGGAATGPSRVIACILHTYDLALEHTTSCVHCDKTSTLTFTPPRTVSPATTVILHRRAGAVPTSDKNSIKLMSPHIESECSENPSFDFLLIVKQMGGGLYFLR